MDPLTEKRTAADVIRMCRIQEHLELGHRLDVEIDGDYIVVACSTGYAQLQLFLMFPRTMPLPHDTCVEDRQTWQMRWRRGDTTLDLLRSDFKE